MRWLLGFVLFLLALGTLRVVACGEPSGTGGSGGDGGEGGVGGGWDDSCRGCQCERRSSAEYHYTTTLECFCRCYYHCEPELGPFGNGLIDAQTITEYDCNRRYIHNYAERIDQPIAEIAFLIDTITDQVVAAKYSGDDCCLCDDTLLLTTRNLWAGDWDTEGCEVISEQGCVPLRRTCANFACCEGLYCLDLPEASRTCAALPSSCKPECDPSSSVCNGGPSPVCGNDGNLYDTSCDAYRAGLDVGKDCGAELTPAGRFPCGPFYCHAAHYCHLSPTDVPSEEKDGYSCEALPDACEAISEVEALCQCVAEEDFARYGEPEACYSVSGNGVTGLFFDKFEL